MRYQNHIMFRTVIALLVLILLAPVFPSQGAAAQSLGERFYEKEYPIVPGLTLSKENFQKDNIRQAANVMKVDLNEPHLSVDAAFSEPVNSLTRLTDFANRETRDGQYVVGGVNASFFYNRTPSNLVAKDNVIYRMTRPSDTPNSPFHHDYAFGIDRNGEALISSFDRRFNVTSGSSEWPVALVNAARSRDNEVIVYTPSLGYNVPNMNHDDSVEVVVSGINDDASTLSFGDTYTGTVEAVHIGRRQQTEIPEDGFVVATYGKEQVDTFKELKKGDELTFSLPINTRWQDASFILGSGPLLVNNGRRSVSMNESSAFAREKAPRTAVGVTASGELLMVTLDGRQPGFSQGVSLTELADYMIEKGAVTAMNFDGGGSTAMLSRIRGAEVPHLVNRPSDGAERAVVNAVQVISTQAPEAFDEAVDAVESFRTMSNWNASAVRGTASASHLRESGASSGDDSARSVRLRYDFTGEQGVSAAYLNPVERPLLEGKPEAIGMWVHGDGRTNWLRGQLTDGEGNTHYINFTEENEFTEPGWQYVTADVPQAAKAPFSLNRVYLAQTKDTMKTKGTLYVNSIDAIHDSEGHEPEEPTHDPIGERFPDVRYSNYEWAVDATAFLVDQQVIDGFPDGNFRPGEQVTREQVAVMLNRQLNLPRAGQSVSFRDVSSSSYAYEAIRSVAEAGIFTGRTEETFDPAAPITRAETAAVLTRAYELSGSADTRFADAQGHWAESQIGTLLANEVTTGYQDGTFRPDNRVTRAEFASFLYRTVHVNRD